MLWIALHLPHLSLESFAVTVPPQAAARPLALLEAQRIADVDARASALGVLPGLKRATALALAPQLVLGQADARRDRRALVSVAHGALAFTPLVSLSPPQGVLLEVQSSLRYFGGHAALLKKLKEALRPLGHEIQFASAPTAQGAALLSKQPGDGYCPDLSTLHRRLELAPLGLLVSVQGHEAALQGMGLQTLGELRRLPRMGVIRRFGRGLLDELDCAWGLQPDPQVSLTAPPFFDSGLELFARADTTEQVLHGAEVLLARLVAWLSARHAFVRRFTLLMRHERRWRHEKKAPEVTVLEVALAQPSRDTGHLQSLLRERLGRLQLVAPTLALSLQSHDIACQAPPNAELFPAPRSEREGLGRLIERLQARLGAQQVQCFRRVEDHRPEKSSPCHAALPSEFDGPPSSARPAAKLLSAVPCLRPVWLLVPAQSLPVHGDRPLLGGRPLTLLSGPERIESGWWDTELAERDYFIAKTLDGALVWLYRTRLIASADVFSVQSSWFLQGRFG